MNVLVNIDVPDLQQAISFYTEAFGLVHVRTMDDAVAELAGLLRQSTCLSTQQEPRQLKT